MHDYYLQLVGPRVSPAAQPLEWGLPLQENGTTAPFVIERGWVGPAGTYIEEWYLRHGDQVVYRHPAKYIEVRGIQAVRHFADTVRTPLHLEPGAYDVMFVVEGFRMGSFEVEVAAPGETGQALAGAAPPVEIAPTPAPVVTPPPRPAPAPAPAAPAPVPAAPAPAAPAPAAPAAVAAPGEDPAAVRKRVYEQELAKGSDPRVAEARAKSAEIRARKAAAVAPAVPAPAPAPAEEAPAQGPALEAPSAPPAAPAAPEASAVPAASAAPSPLLPGAPPGGGGFTPAEAAEVRTMIFEEATARGATPSVAEALAVSAEIRAQRGPWWRPDW